jgi:formamidopyrimidine-DNA glycosylase
MPELAEVEYYRRVWAESLGLPVTGVLLHPEARVFRGCMQPLDTLNRLNGATFHQALAHGKQLLFGFEAVGWLGIHLGMSGQLRCEANDSVQDRHDHLILRLRGRSLVFHDPRMFGRVRFDAGTDLPDWWTQQPPDLLSPGFTRERLDAFLLKRGGTPIKALLLDQSIFPGIGNWMADEILWRSRIHPATPARQLAASAGERLWRTTREVTEDALRVIAPDWGDAPDGWLFNHRWKDGGFCPRPRCRSPLSRADLRGRTTCWCPKCQKSATS